MLTLSFEKRLYSVLSHSNSDKDSNEQCEYSEWPEPLGILHVVFYFRAKHLVSVQFLAFSILYYFNRVNGKIRQEIICNIAPEQTIGMLRVIFWQISDVAFLIKSIYAFVRIDEWGSRSKFENIIFCLYLLCKYTDGWLPYVLEHHSYVTGRELVSIVDDPIGVVHAPLSKDLVYLFF